MNEDEALLLLAKAVNKVQDDVKEIYDLFHDNITFIKNMGDISDQIGKILLDISDNYDASIKSSVDQMRRSSDFFKSTSSNIYPKMNIMQEWFSEFAKETIVIFTGLEAEYVQDWMIVKTQELVMAVGKMTSEMSYSERVAYGEAMFSMITRDLGADPMCHYILRTLFIPYISIYYLRPFTDYPFFDEWKADLARYQVMKEVRDEMHLEHKDYKAFHEEFLKRLKDRANNDKGLIHNHPYQSNE